jgi:hypothetical protein
MEESPAQRGLEVHHPGRIGGVDRTMAQVIDPTRHTVIYLPNPMID